MTATDLLSSLLPNSFSASITTSWAVVT